MRKERIIAMHNNLADTLDNIERDLIKYVENSGAEYLLLGCGITWFKWRDMILGIGSQLWFIDSEQVSFFEFLATITQQ